MNRPMILSRWLSSLFALLLVTTAGCVTTTEDGPTKRMPTGPWLEASPVLRQQIEDEAQRLPWTHGRERVEQIHWFATVGEPAYEKLLELAQDERPDVAGSALAAMGATRDSRLVTSLRQLPWKPDAPPTLRFERARTLLRLGDWSEAPVLIEGLRHESLMMRALCAQALYDTTGERFGYDAKEAEIAREDAVQRWQAWWKERLSEGILASSR
ncbi:MAG: hypothetical protein IPK67_11510 [Planctomycetes bacterium]|nr:hypothetical protein [Planctomycetota bacterium]